MADRYLQDDGKTLKNQLGILHDPGTLATKEAVHVNSRLMELRAHGMPRADGFELVKAVHRHLFQDVYEWAGQPREINLARGLYEGSDGVVQFTPAHRIEIEGRLLFEDLAAAGGLRGLTREQFAVALAPFFGRLNDLHPFREGNGRTQRLIWEHIAREAGHELSFEGISRERMTGISIAASARDYAAARRLFTELLDPMRSRALRTATRFLEEHRTPEFDWQDRYVATTEAGQSYAGTFVGADGNHFMMHDGRSLYIGQLADLPDTGRGLKAGDRVAFQASLEVPPRHVTEELTMSAAERLRARAEQVTERVAAERAAEQAARASPEHSHDPPAREPSKSHEREHGPGSGLDLDS